MKVSIVVPTYQRPKMLAQTLLSLFVQTYPTVDLEIIVVGADGDAGEATVKQSADQTSLSITYSPLLNDPSGGKNPSLKRNHGVSVSNGEWIAFIDDDCVADKDWIKNASQHFNQENTGAVEGKTKVPEVDPPTLTYKGLKRLEKPGGYQTCNMFFRKKNFEELGGFDEKFPFYLEDTDLAWSFLDRGFDIPFAESAIVFHPVVPAQPVRILDGAKRAKLFPYLYKKHPKLYRSSGMAPLRKIHLLYLLLHLCLVVSIVLTNWTATIVFASLSICLLLAQLIKNFWGCRVRIREVLETAWFTTLFPTVASFSLAWGMLRFRTPLWNVLGWAKK